MKIDPFTELRNNLRLKRLKEYATVELQSEIQRRRLMTEERITMAEGDIDNYTHPPIDETQRQEIYRDDHIIIAVLDEKGQGGAHHAYETYENKGVYRAVTRTRFQKGPIGEFGVNGTTNEAELAKVRHRLECFQAGPFPCEENAEALEHINKAIAILEKRTAGRKQRGVEGKNEA